MLVCAGFEIDWNFGSNSVRRIVGPSDIVCMSFEGDGVSRAGRSVYVGGKAEHEGGIVCIF
jgi:hypothetical protein